MIKQLAKGFIIFSLFCFLALIYPPYIFGCTYVGTITGKHLDFSITSDLNNLILVQYRRLGGNLRVTKLYSPNIGTPWNYYSDPNCANHNGQGTIACNQSGLGAYWSHEIPAGTYHTIPQGIYGLDFDSVPVYEEIGIEYAVQVGTPGESWIYCNRTGDIQTPTPSPTPTPTPIPIPVTKVFFIPGFGASWNTNAFLNCSFDNNPDNWSLASYAESIYDPILSTLASSNWDVKPFYYDWRQNIHTNSTSLASKIVTTTINLEKVNLIGHSMGGLIGRQYLTSFNGSRLNKFLAVGSPHMGVLQTYPAWSGGDIWQDNFMVKIASTLYLKHCGNTFSNDKDAIQNNIPSISDMLPIFNYLKNIKLGTFKQFSDMIVQNRWHTNNDFFAHGVSVKTVSGTGYPTLESIQVKEPSKRDIDKGLWEDGKPTGKFYTTNGDGTVLSTSSRLPGVVDILLNQNHTGLVTSSEGLVEILSFLGSSGPLLSTQYEDPGSLLVVISDAAGLIISSDDGNIKRDKNGLISFSNPKNGNYKVNLIPKSLNTILIVAQFLPNNKTLYKEYHLEGLAPKFKSLNFNSKNPKEDILY